MKKQIFLSSLIFTFIISSTMSAQVQGSSFFVDKSTKDFNLHSNQGKREVVLEIKFSKPFVNKPTVLTSISLIDLQGEKFEIDTNSKQTEEIETRGLKIATEATGISRDGFVLKIVVWGNTQVNAVGGNWIAIEQ